VIHPGAHGPRGLQARPEGPGKAPAVASPHSAQLSVCTWYSVT
jgi:hypothetical protein